MKTRLFLAAMLVLAFSIGSVNANPISTEFNKTTVTHNDGRFNSPNDQDHHHKHRHHHHRHH